LHGRSAVTDNNSIVSLVDELVDEQRMYIKDFFRTCLKKYKNIEKNIKHYISFFSRVL